MLVCGFAFGAEPQAAKLRSIILHSRHMGAHGMGYNSASLEELSKKLKPADIPALLSLAKDRKVRVGVQFALASQCEAALVPVRDAARDRRMDYLAALDTVDLIEGFSGCASVARERLAETRARIEADRK